MNNLWKRAASLMLSSVLLMSSVPVQVWATEEDPVDPVDPAAQVQPGDQNSGATDPIMPVDVAEDVLINGEAVVESDKISYADGVLTLNGATINATVGNTGIKTTKSLEIKLIGKNVIDAAELAIEAESDLIISGTGSLIVISRGNVAVKVAGSGDNDDDRKGLTIKDAQISVMLEGTLPTAVDEDGTEPEQPVGIYSPNGVQIRGAAHFKTSHSAPDTVYTLGEGYVSTNGNEFGEAKKTWTATEKGAFVFVGTEHLGAWQATYDESKHYKSCEDSECILIANTKVGVHDASQKYDYKPIDDTKHQEVFTCCKMPKLGSAEEEHDLSCTSEGASITAICEYCKVSETFTLTAQDIEQGSDAQAVIFTAPTGVLADQITEDLIFYKDDEGNRLDGMPTEIGDYTAVISLDEDIKAEVSFSITKINFSRAVVTLALDEGGYIYSGEKYEPDVASVKLGEQEIDFEGATIVYTNNVAAGEATVTVTMPENSEYVNDAVAKFNIAPKALDKGDLELSSAELTYNGQNQIPGFKESALVLNVDYTVTQPEQTKDVGQYTLVVTGKGNYQGTLELAYAIAKTEYYTDATKKTQISGEKVGNLELPKFTGIGGEEVKGTCTYKFTYKGETAEIAASSIQEKINNQMQPGETATLAYVFTPAENSNYTGTKTDSIEITRVDLTFELEDGTKATADHVKKTGNITYGDTDIINTNLIAKVNGVPGNKGEGFTVKYAKDGAPEGTREDAPSVGSNRFWLYYSGTIERYPFTDVLVCEGWITVNSKTWTEEDLTKPVAIVLAEKADGTPLALLTDANKGSIGENSEALEYRVKKADGTFSAWSSDVPTVTEAGCYEVYYRPTEKYKPQTEGMVRVLVIPYLTATYGQTFNDVKNQLPTGFSFNAAAHPDLTKTVGNAGEHKVKLDYTHPNDKNNGQLGDDYPTLTGDPEVTLKVNPKTVTLVVALNADVYDQNDDGYVPFGDATKDDLFIVTADGKTFVNGTDYKLQKTASTDGLTCKHIISVKDGSNYTFETAEGTVKLYKAAHGVLSEDNYPKDTLENYETVDKAKEALSEKLKTDNYPKDLMKFFKVYVTKQVGDKLADNQWAEYTADDAFPPAGLAYEIPYSALSNATEKDNFKVAVLYLAGEDAGKIVLQETALTDTGVKINLEREAVVCVAKEVDLTKEYTITKSVVLDSKTSTQGSLTIKVDNETATKATYGKTVKVTASAKSGYSIVSVTVTDASGNKVETKQDGSNYEFSMPASDVTVKLSLKKTTSSTKNPGSGDSSNIQLWTTILAASGIGVVAALFFWLRKRKK